MINQAKNVDSVGGGVIFIDREAREIIRLVMSLRPSKISVCLSVIRKRSRSKAARSGRGLLILQWFSHQTVRV